MKKIIFALLALVGITVGADAASATTYSHTTSHVGCAVEPSARAATYAEWLPYNDRSRGAVITSAVSNWSAASYGHSAHVPGLEGESVAPGGASFVILNYKVGSTAAGLRYTMRWSDGVTRTYNVTRTLPRGCVR